MLTPDIDDSIDDCIDPLPGNGTDCIDSLPSGGLLPFTFIFTDAERIAVRFAVYVDAVWSSGEYLCKLGEHVLGRELIVAFSFSLLAVLLGSFPILPVVFALSLSCKADWTSAINFSIWLTVMFVASDASKPWRLLFSILVGVLCVSC